MSDSHLLRPAYVADLDLEGYGADESEPAAPAPERFPSAGEKRRDRLSRWLQYLYFLRFCLLGWLLLPLLCVLDTWVTTGLTRGIMTLSSGWQAFHTAFFVTALGMAVLVCARNIVRNGSHRFGSRPPERLHLWLTKCRPRRMWRALVAAHVPTILLLAYVGWRTLAEQLRHGWPYLADGAAGGLLRLLAWYAAGLAAAFAFWYLVTLFYLWTYEHWTTRAPAALLFPPLWPALEQSVMESEEPNIARWAERPASLLLRLTHSGYSAEPGGQLWELHYLTTVALGAFLLLYLFLYPIIAPVVVSTWHGPETWLALLVAGALVYGAFTVKGHLQPIGAFFAVLVLLLLATFVTFLYLDQRRGSVLMERAFPTLAAVLVIVIFLEWASAGAGFLLDRYRVPVLTVLLLATFLPKLLPINQEHYFEVTALPAAMTSLSDPAAALAAAEQRVQQAGGGADDPLVVVTASGGGIQAAEWTAQMMARLETAIREDAALKQRHYRLHDHLLLASGVSGGSVGLLPYLLEYNAPAGQRFADTRVRGDDLTARLTTAPACSSLEAVAWGLEYYDLQRLLLTVRLPWLQSVAGTHVAPDRTWALSRAFARNLSDPDCHTRELTGSWEVKGGELTLGAAAAKLAAAQMPAFTFNTTVAETGGRFLLSNYSVPRVGPVYDTPNNDFMPAESFLQAYAQDPCCAAGKDGRKLYADLTLPGAARLGATFPYVSSATRIPPEYARRAAHFLDGGYFDNDGMASAIEFLYSLMEPQRQQQSAAPATAPRPLKLLVVEIQDGGDGFAFNAYPNANTDDLEHQTGAAKARTDPKAWSTITQLTGPLTGLWNAGHVSVTRRNRRELCLLETAFDGLLEVHHVVFAIPSQPTESAPLSWKLTESQRQYIQEVANGKAAAAGPQTTAQVNDALTWLRGGRATPANERVCHTDDED